MKLVFIVAAIYTIGVALLMTGGAGTLKGYVKKGDNINE